VICALDTIAAHGSATISIILNAAAVSGVVANTASVSSATLDPDLANNAVTASVTVSLAADIPAATPFTLLLLVVTLLVLGALRLRS
jgi:hypothetical protein